jgi:hypothetical protein
MRKLAIALALAGLLLLAGCLPVQSLHPLFSSQNDLVSNPFLVGRWVDADDADAKAAWEIAESKDQSYLLAVKDPDGPEEWKFRAYLVRLGQSLFLDVSIIDLGVHGKDVGVPIFALATHSFHRVWLDENSLRLRSLDDDWLKKALDEKQIAIPHESLEDNLIILTAPSQDLQKLVLKFADDTKAFSGEVHLVRSKEKP